MRFLNPKTFMLPSNDINRVWIKPSNSYWVGSKDYYLSIVKTKYYRRSFVLLEGQLGFKGS